jgi:putative phage-type endonuclease
MDMEQLSAEWFAARLGKFTASRASYLMDFKKNGDDGAARTRYIRELAVERLTGKPIQSADSFAMRRGRELEPQAVDAYTLATGNVVDFVGFVENPDYPNAGASPDGLIGDDGGLEVKCPLDASKHLMALIEGSHAEEYRWQVQFQLMITGRAWWDIVSYHPDFPVAQQVARCRVWPDPEKHALLKSAMNEAEYEIDALLEPLMNEVSA